MTQSRSQREYTEASEEQPLPPSIDQRIDTDNCFRILVATDNHIGYAEKDPVRGQDSINTFREILQIAQKEQVDFILLAGDLFHENRPSRTCMHQTIALLREYTLGDKAIPFELLSDPMDGATPGFNFPAVNYEDPNLNIAIPVFSIHGNHDDPQGTGPEGALCALDVLSVSGVLNYFGKVSLADEDAQSADPDKGIRIKPVLLRKGDTHLALYGCGNVRDQRMNFELRSNRVKMYVPTGGEVADDEWFNILLVHQNRVKHGPQQHVPEGMFDDSIQLVIWGHEHDCRLTPESVPGKPYYISQPGSSVATSLSAGEAIPKHVGILSVQGAQFGIEEIQLKTVRPMAMGEVVLGDEAKDGAFSLDERDEITMFLRGEVEKCIAQTKEEWDETHTPEDGEMMLPLVRLKVETTDAKDVINPVRFGQEYIGRVANPRDLLQYYRRKKVAERKPKNNADLPDSDDIEEEPQSLLADDEASSKLRMAHLVGQYLKAQELGVLVEGGLEEAVMRFVEKDDRDAIKDFVAKTTNFVGKMMLHNEEFDPDTVKEQMWEAKNEAVARHEKEKGQFELKKNKGKGKSRDEDADSMAEEDDDDAMSVDSESDRPAPKKAPARGPGSRGGRGGARGGAARGKAPAKSTGRGKSQALFDAASDDNDISDPEEEEEEEEEEEPAPRKGRGRAAVGSSTAAAKKAPAKKAPARKAPAAKKAPAKASARGGGGASQMAQSQLSFSQGGAGGGKKTVITLSDSDD
ncbi:DNA repair protein (mre11) [Cryptococcus floricola]|uniref:Double-strand break repair protein n=1 Tax=Cryptococcus floricola TaxID=2591691 RepID=A0A5D3B2T1_9TREE|nr:DNA repair protein (mre11) [Cryptococcus floricola]